MTNIQTAIRVGKAIQMPVRTNNRIRCHQNNSQLVFRTSPVSAAVDIYEEDAKTDHELHECPQRPPVLGLGYLRGVGRGREHKHPATEASDEPSDEEHGGVFLGEGEKNPAADEGDRDHYQGPFLTDKLEGGS